MNKCLFIPYRLPRMDEKHNSTQIFLNESISVPEFFTRIWWEFTYRGGDSGCCITRYYRQLLKTATVLFPTQFASLLRRIVSLAINHVYNLGQVLCESSSLGNSLSLVSFSHLFLSFLMSLPSSSRRAVSVQRKHFLTFIWSTNSALTIRSSSFLTLVLMYVLFLQWV